ncbi:periplasmic heavy metal sensor [Phenylobacterium soli]|uniref:periplasmic heavy metal sensor n=1 Tax=Phenylobacterium soli TaxID=2170551 RepID=UPI001403BBB6|nr:periplasmic heavy metal sensor [Phenylobacterium soli]
MSRRTLIILLFVSLALNLFVIGAATGAFVLGERMHRRTMEPRGGPAMLVAAQALPDEEREAYRKALRAQAGAVGPKLRESHKIRREAWGRLGADPLDAKGIAADLDHARALETGARGDVDHAILEFAEHLPAADRARLGQALAQPMRHGGHGDPRERPPAPPPQP